MEHRPDQAPVAPAAPSGDDADLGWGEDQTVSSDERRREQRLLEERPPHWA